MADHTVTVNWANTLAVNSNLTPGSILVSISGGNLSAPLTTSVAATAITADVAGVPEESATDPLYVASVQMFDNSTPAIAIGAAAVSTPFSVLAPIATVLTPTSVSVAVQ